MSELVSHKKALLESLPTCSLCSEKVFSSPNLKNSLDHRFVRPCLCPDFMHHGCAVAQIAKSKTCPVCQKVYSFRVYGSFCDYFDKHKCSIISVLLTYLFVALVSLYLLVIALEYDGDSRIVFACSITFVFVFSTTALFFWLHELWSVKLQRFKRRFAQTTVNFHPDLSLPPEKQLFLTSYWFSIKTADEDQAQSTEMNLNEQRLL